jgi:hypothetical protein
MDKEERELLKLQIAIRDELSREIGKKLGRVFKVKPNE